ncbi:MAG: GNAT family N-acetyltransferase [Ktedonobacterales bacterium]|nr:GNAT family N-acetyltransferase [Ktedonobacterales bacterium]
MDLELRPITDDEYMTFSSVAGAAFSTPPTEAESERWRAMLELDRSLAAFANGQMVGTAGAFSFELTLPGLTRMPVGGVTWVSVLPTHRRQGILTQMMRRQLDDVRARGEPAAILYAAESGIYERFGYGLATSMVHLSIERPYGRLARAWEPTGQVRLIEHERALEVFPELYERVRLRQPGAVNRVAVRWNDYLHAPMEPMDGFGPRFYVHYESAPGVVEGAMHYRVKQDWADGLSSSTLRITELIALTAEARAALWSYAFCVDLIRTVVALSRPVDDPVRWLLADPRRLRVTALRDEVWLRLLDIPAALATRRYTGAGTLVFAVADAFLAGTAGSYMLEAGADGAECRPTADDADLALDVADLGAAYLGGVSFSTLARAGRVVELKDGALARADALFASDPAPYCGTPF